MNKKFAANLFVFAVLAITFSACQRDSSLYKIWHNTNARFNGYFNAKEKMLEIEDKMFDNHADNYSRVIDVFTGTDDKTAKTYSGDCDLLMKKCANVIKKHSSSKWVKNCYFLIAKGNFYKRDFYTAIETFEYVSEKYPDDQVGQDAKVYLLRCYVEMGKMNDALSLLSAYEADKKFPVLAKPFLSLAEADYYIKTGEYKNAIPKMEYALARVKVKKYRTRYMFILAQLYQATGENAKSASFYKMVIKRNPPYDLSFQSRLKLAEVSSNNDEVERFLSKLLKDDKNISYYDQIYYTMAKVELKKNNTDKALEYLHMSTRYSKGNDNQKAMSYMLEADIYFKKPAYAPAKAYYDSAAKFITKDYPDYDAIKARQAVLGDLIGNLITVQLQDSLLKISKMDTASLNKLIDNIIETNKQRSIQNQNKTQQVQEDNSVPGLSVPGTSMGFSGGKESYFYNSLALSQGYSDFISKWGNRPRTDDWRRKNKPVQTNNPNERTGETGDSSGGGQGKGMAENGHGGQGGAIAGRQKYYQPIPFTPSQKNIANNKIQEALMGIGGIYFNSLHDLKKSEEAYEDLLQRYPNSSYAAQAHYQLYQVYAADSNKQKSDYHKDIILKDFPETIYATLIVNPDKLREKYVKSRKNEELEAFYGQVYAHFMANDCNALDNDVAVSNSKFTKNYLKPKIEYLDLVCKGKKDSVPRFVEALKGFMKKYPGEDVTADVKKQIDYLESLQKKQKNEKLSQDSVKTREQLIGQHLEQKVDYQKTETQAHRYVIVIPAKADENVVKTALNNFNNEDYASQGLKITSVMLDQNRKIIMVTNFADTKQAMQYYNELEKSANFYNDLALQTHKEFIISDTNFQLFQKHTDVEGYSKFFKENY